MQEEKNINQTTQLEGDTYGIIRTRLLKQQGELSKRLDQLNTERKKVFGSIETKLLATDRINTSNNCIARDIFALGDTVLFGYNVHIGLRSEIKIEDVFSIYKFSNNAFQEQEVKLLSDEKFIDSFKNLYKYYRETVFTKFARIGNYLYMVFQVSKNIGDIKTFKWLIKENELQYVDDRSDHEYKFPEQLDFSWSRLRRDDFRDGKHPHVSIKDKLFVEAVGGDITIKIEDNTDDGKGIYAEEVAQKEQKLDDGEYYYADLGNLFALKIRPYQEDYRYFIYNDKVKEAKRIDTIASAAILLPDDQGLIFSNGYYLQTGQYKFFDNKLEGLKFEQKLSSPNGEDFLYIFFSPEQNVYILLSYNIIEQQVENPVICNGFTLFPNGEMAYFKSEEESTKHHVIQIWQTPYTQSTEAPSDLKDSYLYKVGNKDIVKAMAEAYELIALLNKEDSYQDLYYDLSKKSNDIIDAYYWIGEEQAFNLQEPITSIRKTATAAIDEFDKVQSIKKSTAKSFEELEKKIEEQLEKTKYLRFESINDYVQVLNDFRIIRGETISLKELRYIDLERVEVLEQKLVEQSDKVSENCVKFLSSDKALAPYIEDVEAKNKLIPELKSATQAKKLDEEIDVIGQDLKMLIEIVGNLKIEDATQTTKIIDSISAIFANLNKSKSVLKQRLNELRGTESVANFSAQAKLLDQSLINYLSVVETPVQADEYLNKLMVQLEDLEGKFADYDEFTVEIAEKREEIYEAFENRKLQLVEAYNRKTNALMNSAERILKGIKNKLATFKTNDEINAYFAADLMVEKVRDISSQLRTLEDPVKSDDVAAQLKAAKEEAVRQLKDKNELFVDGENIIKLGKHQFSVNTQKLDLSIVPQGEDMCFHLMGTNFFEPITNADFIETKPFWNQQLISENELVYRAEFLAFSIFNKLLKDTYKGLAEDEKIPFINKIIDSRIQESYVKGVHNEDAKKILDRLIEIDENIDLLKFGPEERAAALLFWEGLENEGFKTDFQNEINGAAQVLKVFPESKQFFYLIDKLEEKIIEFKESAALNFEFNTRLAAAYLYEELLKQKDYIVSLTDKELAESLIQYLKETKSEKGYNSSLEALKEKPIERFQLIGKWVLAFLAIENADERWRYQGIASFLWNEKAKWRINDTNTSIHLNEMLGDHKLIEKGTYSIEFLAFINKLKKFDAETVMAYKAYQDLKRQVIEEEKANMRLEEFKPRVLSSFVRNELIDKVYLPILGDNLSKQIGSVGDTQRTDRMGLLLLISPPGYGKTTLMEYLSNRLGLVFMKINGPALGHYITSVDPMQADSAGAKQELEKLNLAFEMGDNVMIYLDDIQHCHPEFLQKFISLCDAQRKIEGTYKGKTKTYDFRGKKVCVVMAGNPYTESGEKFQIPDMLANRADIYNLGDILGDAKAEFELSYLENAMTSNPILQKLTAKGTDDVKNIIKIAQQGNQEGITLVHKHSPEEINDYVSIIEKMIRVRDVVLNVNQEYIRSASINDEYRTEPPFKLQGSYRNMNKMVEKLVPIMNDKELETLIVSHYENESQTLTNGSEANLLKFKALVGLANAGEQKRWEQIKTIFSENKKAKNDSALSDIASHFGEYKDSLEGIRKLLNDLSIQPPDWW